MKNRFIFWLMSSLAVSLSIYVAVRVSIVLMGLGGTLSDIKKISVHSSNGETADIITQLGISTGTKHIDLSDALARISANPDISAVAIRRLPNGEIKIRADMRIVVASWTDGEKYYPLDNTGSPINRPLPARPENTLIFSGKVPKDISNVTNTLKHTPGLFYRIDKMEFVEDRRWDIFLRNGIRIMMPEENFEEAIKKLDKTNKQNMVLDRQIKLLDMRDISRPLIKI